MLIMYSYYSTWMQSMNRFTDVESVSVVIESMIALVFAFCMLYVQYKFIKAVFIGMSETE